MAVDLLMKIARRRLSLEAIQEARAEYFNAYPKAIKAIYAPSSKIPLVRYLLSVLGLNWETRATVEDMPWFLSGDCGNLISAPVTNRPRKSERIDKAIEEVPLSAIWPIESV